MKLLGNSRGISLVIILIMMVIMTMLGVYLLNKTIGDMQTTSAKKNKTHTDYVAEGSLNLVIREISDNINANGDFDVLLNAHQKYLTFNNFKLTDGVFSSTPVKNGYNLSDSSFFTVYVELDTNLGTKQRARITVEGMQKSAGSKLLSLVEFSFGSPSLFRHAVRATSLNTCMLCHTRVYGSIGIAENKTYQFAHTYGDEDHSHPAGTADTTRIFGDMYTYGNVTTNTVKWPGPNGDNGNQQKRFVDSTGVPGSYGTSSYNAIHDQTDLDPSWSGTSEDYDNDPKWSGKELPTKWDSISSNTPYFQNEAVTSNGFISATGGAKIEKTSRSQTRNHYNSDYTSVSIINQQYSDHVVLNADVGELTINNTVYIGGDVLIKGRITGQGKLIVKGNIYIGDRLAYKNAPSSYEKPTTADYSKDKFFMGAGGSIILGRFSPQGSGTRPDHNWSWLNAQITSMNLGASWARWDGAGSGGANNFYSFTVEWTDDKTSTNWYPSDGGRYNSRSVTQSVVSDWSAIGGTAWVDGANRTWYINQSTITTTKPGVLPEGATIDYTNMLDPNFGSKEKFSSGWGNGWITSSGVNVLTSDIIDTIAGFLYADNLIYGRQHLMTSSDKSYKFLGGMFANDIEIFSPNNGPKVNNSTPWNAKGSLVIRHDKRFKTMASTKSPIGGTGGGGSTVQKATIINMKYLY